MARVQLAQQVADLQERIESEERHRQSLEEKHEHVRQALDHFRSAAKEQRDQEQRQHEQQVQYLQGEVRMISQTLSQRQQEAIQSNKENTHLSGELARAEAELHDAKLELQRLKNVNDQLVSAQQLTENLGRRVVELEASNRDLLAKNEVMEAKAAENTDQIQQLKVELAAAQAAATTQGQITEKIQALIALAPANRMKKFQAAVGR